MRVFDYGDAVIEDCAVHAVFEERGATRDGAAIYDPLQCAGYRHVPSCRARVELEKAGGGWF